MSKISKQTIEDILLDAIVLTNDAVGIFDQNDTVVFCNFQFCDIFALTEEEALGQTFEHIVRGCFDRKLGIKIDSDDIEAWLEMALSKRRSKPFRTFEVDTCEQRWFRLTEMMVGEYMFTYATDVTESKQLELELIATKNKLQRLASTDYLTGIYNRREFNKLAEQELLRCERNGLKATLLLLDLDHFKTINDTYGHAGGDSVLVGVTDRIKGELRGYDIFARIGGEEFAILLPEVSEDNAIDIAERCLTKVSEIPFYFEGQDIEVSVSIGMSVSSSNLKSLDDVLKSADRRLYHAKQSGRNQLCKSA